MHLTDLFLSQARIWISNVICRSLLFVSQSWGQRWLFYGYWWNCWSSLCNKNV